MAMEAASGTGFASTTFVGSAMALEVAREARARVEKRILAGVGWVTTCKKDVRPDRAMGHSRVSMDGLTRYVMRVALITWLLATT